MSQDSHGAEAGSPLLRWLKESMSRTESMMLDLGTQAPSFALPDVVSGKTITLDPFADKKALLVMFICRHCPYVKHVQHELAKLGSGYAGKSVGILAISSNDAVAYPDDAPQNLRQMALELDFRFPYCYDETQDAARSFHAVCTPDFFVFDQDRRLAYRGRLDDSRPRSSDPVTGNELRAAIEAVLDDRAVDPNQRPSMGCNIKWRS
jgi:peroxiredoxin